MALPSIKWDLLYGVILCKARTMGEFGAVYVVSTGVAEQNALSLYINLLEHECRGINLVPTFAVSSFRVCWR